MINKIVQSMAEAMAGIRDSAVVLIGGFGSIGQPNALIPLSGIRNDPPAWPAWGWGRIGPRAPVVSETPSVLRVRADCGCRFFTAKFSVVVHYLAHQLFDHLLADEAILLACQFSDRLRDRVDHFICFVGIDFV